MIFTDSPEVCNTIFSPATGHNLCNDIEIFFTAFDFVNGSLDFFTLHFEHFRRFDYLALCDIHRYNWLLQLTSSTLTHWMIFRDWMNGRRSYKSADWGAEFYVSPGVASVPTLEATLLTPPPFTRTVDCRQSAIDNITVICPVIVSLCFVFAAGRYCCCCRTDCQSCNNCAPSCAIVQKASCL